MGLLFIVCLKKDLTNLNCNESDTTFIFVLDFMKKWGEYKLDKIF